MQGGRVLTCFLPNSNLRTPGFKRLGSLKFSSAGHEDVAEETVLRFQHPLADNPQHLNELLGVSKDSAAENAAVANPFGRRQQNRFWQPGDRALKGSLSTPIG